jgi:hypothetical protein
MILATSVDDMRHRLVGQTAHHSIESRRTIPCAARVDEDGACICFDQSERCVVAQVFRVSLRRWSLDSPDPCGDTMDR